MAVFDITKPGVWHGESGYWTFVPNTKDNKATGTELVSDPPKIMINKASEGPLYPSPADGHVYEAWLVPGPTHPALQRIIRWDSPLPPLI